MKKSDISRAFQTFQGQRGRGPRALFVAVMAAAAVDLANGDRGAARYFLSDTYRHHLELVGLPAEYLPAGVTRADVAALANGQAAAGNRSEKETMKRQPAIAIDHTAARRRELAGMLTNHKNYTARLSEHDRIWATRELNHLRVEGNNLDTWQAARARYLELEAETNAAVAERAKAAEEAKAAAVAKLAAREEAQRRRLAEDNDPLNIWRRQQAERTF